jgi:hypothetical protein
MEDGEGVVRVKRALGKWTRGLWPRHVHARGEARAGTCRLKTPANDDAGARSVEPLWLSISVPALHVIVPLPAFVNLSRSNKQCY